MRQPVSKAQLQRGLLLKLSLKNWCTESYRYASTQATQLALLMLSAVPMPAECFVESSGILSDSVFDGTVDDPQCHRSAVLQWLCLGHT